MLRKQTRPGKFEGALIINEYVYELSLVGCDDEHTDGGSWWGLFKGSINVCATARLDMDMTPEEVQYLESTIAGAIVREDSNGFVDVYYYTQHENLMSVWAGVLECTELY